MSTILSSRRITIEGNGSPLTFATEGGGHWKVWDRFLLLDGKKAYHMGNICGTCTFFFERLPGANASVNPAEVVDALTAGIASLSSYTIDQITKIVPAGQYVVSLLEILPALTTPGAPNDYFTKEQVELWGCDPFYGLPHNPKTEYYRIGTRMVNEHSRMFEFLVPMFPHGWLDRKRVSEMTDLLRADKKPTGIALSVLDIKQPADWRGDPTITEHWCLAHYLIDGHHKTYAASQDNRTLTLLSFLALGEGVSSEEQKLGIAELMKTS